MSSAFTMGGASSVVVTQDVKVNNGLVEIQIPASIDAIYAQDLKSQVRGMVDGDIDDFYPEVVVSYASGRRPDVDAEGTGPGFVQAFHFIKLLQQNGHHCFSGLHVPVAENWEIFMLRLRGDDAKAKIMIALLSDAYFRSIPCLKEVDAAMKGNVTILPVRLEDQWPEKSEQWMKIVKDGNSSNKLMRMKVQDHLQSLNAIPHPGTILTVSTAFGEVLKKIRETCKPDAAVPSRPSVTIDHGSSPSSKSTEVRRASMSQEVSQDVPLSEETKALEDELSIEKKKARKDFDRLMNIKERIELQKLFDIAMEKDEFEDAKKLQERINGLAAALISTSSAPEQPTVTSTNANTSTSVTSVTNDDQWHVNLLKWIQSAGNFSDDSVSTGKDDTGRSGFKRFEPKYPKSKEDLLELTALRLDNCKIGGEIPESLSHCSRLKHLWISFNNLSGPIPSSLQKCENLEVLYLGSNQLTGEIPKELGNCIQLTHLALSENKLTGKIPKELGKCMKLELLYLDQNQLTGKIPKELGNCIQLTQLFLDSNKLTGEIPKELGNCIQLEALLLHDNNLEGEIPKELGNCIQLKKLTLWNNQLTGEIPKELGNCIQLSILDLSQNKLTGEIPKELGNCINLQYLSLWSNNLTGEIPKELGNCIQLTYLGLSQNKLTGEIPKELGNCMKLEQLYLRVNQLTGEIPKELGNCIQLKDLKLRGNKLTGEIPKELGNCMQLTYLDLESNKLTGKIPKELGNCIKLEKLFLSQNKLTGEIPKELGNCIQLKELSLYQNQLTGKFPKELGNCRNLQYWEIV